MIRASESKNITHAGAKITGVSRNGLRVVSHVLLLNSNLNFSPDAIQIFDKHMIGTYEHSKLLVTIISLSSFRCVLGRLLKHLRAKRKIVMNRQSSSSKVRKDNNNLQLTSTCFSPKLAMIVLFKRPARGHQDSLSACHLSKNFAQHVCKK